MSADATLRLTEIFHSLQGEARTVGLPTVFVRLTGCPLRCQYCDTAYAFEGGNQFTLKSIVQEVVAYDCRHVTVTGGEPLAQPNCLPLMKLLCDQGLSVSLETSGAMPIESVDERVSIVLDLKTPGSLESNRNLYENTALLQQKDQVKFVICDRQDYEWAKAKLLEYNLVERVGDVLFSPSFSQVNNAELAQWILQDRLKVRMQLQLHKIIWGDEPGR
ncbi:MAG: 7-carboxy-7-deazaguanine synthase QueE [Gammaproteobacteria bacterium]